MTVQGWKQTAARYGIIPLLVLAFAIQFYHLDARTFHGDELGSILEAQRLGLNANSLPYFAWLRLWLPLGDGEFWLRSISALAMVSSIAVTYVWVRKLSNASTARIAALLLATSPFLVVYGQQVRFYGIAVLGATLSLWAFTELLVQPSARRIAIWILAAVVAGFALLLNALLVLGQGVTLFFLSRRLRPRAKILVGLVVIVVGLVAITTPAVRQFAFNAMAFYTNADTRYLASRGIGLANFAKIPMTYFFFTFGESVYPLNYALVVPGVLVFGVAALIGLAMLWRKERRAFWLVLAVSGTALSLLYLVLDPLSPPGYQGAAPRYVIFLLPIFFFALASGLQGRFAWLVIPLLLVNLVSLVNYWSGDWAYTDDLVDWRAVTRWIGEYVTPQTVLWLDGSAQGMASQYFPHAWQKQVVGTGEVSSDFLGSHDSQRVIMVLYNWHEGPRQENTAALQAVAGQYVPVAVWNKYPLFVYVYDRKSGDTGTYAVNANGSIDLPLQIYGIEFQDLRLPLALKEQGTTVLSFGGFGLPGLNRQTARTLDLAAPRATQQIVLFSDLTGANARAGAAVGNLIVRGSDGLTQTIPLRAGYETAGWNDQCQPAACVPAYNWRKRLALVGSESYPGSWQEFNASIFAADLELKMPTSIQSLKIERVSSPGTLYVWGIMLQP